MNRPFDETRYRGLLEGLEASEIFCTALERTKRIDAEFFRPYHLRIAAKLTEFNTNPINKVAEISDGNHFAISEEFRDEGIPYFRGQDVVGHFFIEQAKPVYITKKAYTQAFMARSHLKRGDVLLSIVGTIGEASLVSTDTPSTCSCKLAILRPNNISPEYLAIFLRTIYGCSQIERFTRGAVQMGFLLEDMDQIHVAWLNPDFEKRICLIVEDAQKSLNFAQETVERVEQTLLCSLGLENWQPPEPLTYARSSKEVFASNRIDAEHYREGYYSRLGERPPTSESRLRY